MKHSHKLFLVALFLVSACRISPSYEYYAKDSFDSTGNSQALSIVYEKYYQEGYAIWAAPLGYYELAKGRYVNGVPEGKWLVSYDGKTPTMELNYQNGKIEGEVKLISPDPGSAQYKNGHMNGILEAGHSGYYAKMLVENDRIVTVYQNENTYKQNSAKYIFDHTQEWVNHYNDAILSARGKTKLNSDSL